MKKNLEYDRREYTPGTVEWFMGQLNVVKNSFLIYQSHLFESEVLTKDAEMRAAIMEKAKRAMLYAQVEALNDVLRFYTDKLQESATGEYTLGELASWESELLFERARSSIYNSVEIDLYDFTRANAVRPLSVPDARALMNLFKKDLEKMTPAIIGYITRAFALAMKDALHTEGLSVSEALQRAQAKVRASFVV